MDVKKWSAQLQRRLGRGLIFTTLLASALAHADAGDTAPKFNSERAGLEFLRSCNMVLANGGQQLDLNASNPYLNQLITYLNTWVIGQPVAVQSFASAINIALAGLNDPMRPLGKILMPGPTGVGKTQLVRMLVSFLGGDPDVNLIRIDGGELGDGMANSAAKGSEAGYAGYKDKPILHPDNLAAARMVITRADGSQRTIVVILIDEIEKLNPTFLNLLLGPLDNGKIRLGDNTKVDLRDAIILATTNLGALEVEALIKAKELQVKTMQQNSPVLTLEQADVTGRHDRELGAKIRETYESVIGANWTPEFINRWDAIVEFHHLTHPEFYEILQKELGLLQKTVFEQGQSKVGLIVTEALRQHLVETGTNPRFGARDLQRTIRKWVQSELANQMTAQALKNGDVIVFDIQPDGLGKLHLTAKIVAQGLSQQQLIEFANQVYPGRNMLNVQFDKKLEIPEGALPRAKTSMEKLNESQSAMQQFNMWIYSEGQKGIDAKVMRNGQSTSGIARIAKVADSYLTVTKFSDDQFQVNRLATLPADFQSRLSGQKVPEMTEEELARKITEWGGK